MSNGSGTGRILLASAMLASSLACCPAFAGEQAERAGARYQLLEQFNKKREGSYPVGQIAVGRDGKMYGTNSVGGEFGWGTAFRLLPSGEPELLVQFGGPDTSLWEPLALLAASDGYLYGVAWGNRVNTHDGIFRLSIKGQIKKILDFKHTPCHVPLARLTEASDGRLYGSTREGGEDAGCIFSVGTDGDFKLIRELTPADGKWPYAAMVQASDGHLYGTLPRGGVNECGTLYRVALGGDEFEVVHTFLANEGICNPYPALIEGPDGLLYGTTTNDYAPGAGTAYRFDPATRAVTLVHDFKGPEGATPRTMTLGRDGLFYGVTENGGKWGRGVVFRMTTEGAVEPLHSFTKQQGNAAGALLERDDGEFYGFTSDSHPSHQGTVYRIRTH